MSSPSAPCSLCPAPRQGSYLDEELKDGIDATHTNTHGCKVRTQSAQSQLQVAHVPTACHGSFSHFIHFLLKEPGPILQLHHLPIKISGSWPG
eukprot:2950344-Amphidinium_carterae.1